MGEGAEKASAMLIVLIRELEVLVMLKRGREMFYPDSGGGVIIDRRFSHFEVPHHVMNDRCGGPLFQLPVHVLESQLSRSHFLG